MYKSDQPWISMVWIWTALGLMACQEQMTLDFQEAYRHYQLTTSGSGEALDAWNYERSYPATGISMTSFREAAAQVKESSRHARGTSEWEALGPNNLGGRTLCLVFHPTQPNILFAGSASGGLWKSTSRGIGANAWEYVPTGFPVLGVSAIAIDDNNPDLMFIGTGEGYNSFGLAEPGTVNRFTRGTYGIGILKSIDGGSSWSHSLQFDAEEIIVVKDLVIADNAQEIYAATTDGLYKSNDQGTSWSQIFGQGPINDVEIDPNDDRTLYFTQGNLNLSLDPTQVGIFKSDNGGDSFRELQDPGLLTAWSGSAKISIHPAAPNIIYASIQVGWFNNEATTPAGLYKSSDFGESWTRVNDTNVAFWQGWYSHDVALHPTDTHTLIHVGLDAWLSTDGGNTLTKASDWRLTNFGKIPVDSSTKSTFVHADIHGALYHPDIPDLVFLFGDGGFFSSEDGGQTFSDRNGGYQTTQFYPNFSNSSSDPNFAIGGAQDNSTFIYDGTKSWIQAVGGDGMSAAINPLNDEIVYASAQGLFLVRSVDRGDTFAIIRPTLDSAEFPAFSAPYELAPSHPSTIYAGAQSIYKSEDGGDSWFKPAPGLIDGGNFVTNIAIAPSDPNLLYIATSPNPFSGLKTAKVLRSNDGGVHWDPITGLPNLIAKDIAIDPENQDIVFIAFSGFASPHVYKSLDGGRRWIAASEGLPDLPTNTILIDPLNTDHIYVGNDLGVYHSDNGAASWRALPSGFLDATLVIHLSISPANRKLRIATHGHGIYQCDLLYEPSVNVTELGTKDRFHLATWPNPFDDELHIALTSDKIAEVELDLIDISGKKIESLFSGSAVENKNITLNLAHLKLTPGAYFLTAKAGQAKSSRFILKM